MASTTYKNIVEEYSSSRSAVLEIQSMVTNKVVSFPAFLTNIAQNFKSSWQTENVFGRNDPIATFQNTTRTIALGWDVPSASIDEAIANHKKFSSLIKFLYPGYLNVDPFVGPLQEGQTAPKKNLVLARPPLVKVKFANLIQAQDGRGLLGYIDGIDWKPTLDMGMFTIDGKFYPKVISLSFNLNVLHQQDIGFDESNNWLGKQGNYPFSLE